MGTVCGAMHDCGRLETYILSSANTQTHVETGWQPPSRSNCQPSVTR